MVLTGFDTLKGKSKLTCRKRSLSLMLTGYQTKVGGLICGDLTANESPDESIKVMLERLLIG